MLPSLREKIHPGKIPLYIWERYFLFMSVFVCFCVWVWIQRYHHKWRHHCNALKIRALSVSLISSSPKLQLYKRFDIHYYFAIGFLFMRWFLLNSLKSFHLKLWWILMGVKFNKWLLCMRFQQSYWCKKINVFHTFSIINFRLDWNQFFIWLRVLRERLFFYIWIGYELPVKPWSEGCIFRWESSLAGFKRLQPVVPGRNTITKRVLRRDLFGQKSV